MGGGEGGGGAGNPGGGEGGGNNGEGGGGVGATHVAFDVAQSDSSKSVLFGSQSNRARKAVDPENIPL